MKGDAGGERSGKNGIMALLVGLIGFSGITEHIVSKHICVIIIEKDRKIDKCSR